MVPPLTSNTLTLPSRDQTKISAVLSTYLTTTSKPLSWHSFEPSSKKLSLCLFLATLFFVWITIPAVSVFLIAFVKSFRWRSGWHKAMFGCGLGTILLLVAYLLFRAPETRCNPDIMAEHYEKHKAEMEEFCDYMQSALADSTSVTLEFKGNRLEMFHVAGADAD